MKRITPDIISYLRPDEIFVFGSNLQGRHTSGTAKTALDKYGAKMGVGLGLQGQSYAIPTINVNLSSIESYVKTFILFAKNNHKRKFYVTPIDCGITGYTPEQIAPLFSDAIDCVNIFLPNNFWSIIERKKRLDKYRDNIQETNYTIDVVSRSTGIRTSNYPFLCIDVQVQDSNLIVSSGIANNHISLCTILKKADDVIEKDYVDGNIQFVKKIPTLSNPPYTLDLYFQKDKMGLYYRQLSVPLDVKGCVTRIPSPIFYNYNSSFFTKIPVDGIFLQSKLKLTAVVPGALVEFRNLATKITKYDSSEYNKLLSVHD